MWSGRRRNCSVVKIGRFVWRYAVIFLCALFIFYMVHFLIDEASSLLEDRNRGQSIEDYDYHLYDVSFFSLRDYLSWHCPQGEEFQLYWDVSDAYMYASQREFWGLVERRLAEQTEAESAGQGQPGSEQSGPYAGPEESAEKYRAQYEERLRRVYEDSGETARKIIRSFAEDMAEKGEGSGE